jgi:acetyl-CoA acetyltransferase
MPPEKPTTVVIGVGDVKNRSLKVEDAIEPVELMLKATLKAIQDTNISAPAAKELQSKIDHVGVVNTWTWNYPDLPSLISDRLGVKPRYKVLSHHGGDSPAKLFDEAARRISLGLSKVAIVTGGEALASCMSVFLWAKDSVAKLIEVGACAAAGKLPPPGWSMPDTKARSVSASDVSKLRQSKLP